jgi:hypothetical protein
LTKTRRLDVAVVAAAVIDGKTRRGRGVLAASIPPPTSSGAPSPARPSDAGHDVSQAIDVVVWLLA